MNNKIQEFAETFIPKNLSKKRKSLLSQELSEHLYEKAEYYVQKGLEENDAIEKSCQDFCADEGEKNKIRNAFEEMYHEKVWYVILSVLSVFAVNILAYVCGAWVNGPEMNRDITSIGMISSLLLTLIVIFEIYILYHKGMRKSLIAIGIMNLLGIYPIIFCFYPQVIFYSLTQTVYYFSDRFTSLSMLENARINDGFIVGIITVIFEIIFAVVCFILSAKIKKEGIPKKSGCKGLVSAFVIVSVISVFSFIMCGPATQYFKEYKVWFSTVNDSIIEETKKIFDAIEPNAEYDSVKQRISGLGYFSTEDYIKTLDKKSAIQFKNNLKNENFFFDDEYEIFFNPQFTENHTGKKNGFIFLKKDTENKIISKGIGNGSESINKYGRTFHEARQDNIKLCMQDFKNLKSGDSKEKILQSFGNEYGEIYTNFITYSGSDVEEYYRIFCNSYDIAADRDDSLYIEFHFKNDVLTNGNMHILSVGKNGIENDYKAATVR